MLPKKGKVFRGGNDRGNRRPSCAELIARALRQELGDSHRATKTLMRWTGASARTVKGWLAGDHAPSAGHLLAILGQSASVFDALAIVAGRQETIAAGRILAAQAVTEEGMALLRRGLPACDGSAQSAGGERVMRTQPFPGDGIDDRGNVQINDRTWGPAQNRAGGGLNQRQRWMIDALASGLTIRAGDVQRRWAVSEKTARRDLAILAGRGLIVFIGSRKAGRYVLAG